MKSSVDIATGWRHESFPVISVRAIVGEVIIDELPKRAHINPYADPIHALARIGFGRRPDGDSVSSFRWISLGRSWDSVCRNCFEIGGH